MSRADPGKSLIRLYFGPGEPSRFHFSGIYNAESNPATLALALTETRLTRNSQAAKSSRSSPLTLATGTLSHVLTCTDRLALVRKQTKEAGAHSSRCRTRKLVDDGRFATLVARIEERAAARKPESRRQTNGAVRLQAPGSETDRQSRARDRGRAHLVSPSLLVLVGRPPPSKPEKTTIPPTQAAPESCPATHTKRP